MKSPSLCRSVRSVCTSVYSMYLVFFIIVICASTVQFLDILITVINKLVDEVVVSEDKRLKPLKQLATSMTRHFVHVVDQTWEHKTLIALHFTALCQLATVKHTNIQSTRILPLYSVFGKNTPLSSYITYSQSGNQFAQKFLYLSLHECLR